MDIVFTLKQINEEKLPHNFETHVVYIDLKKVYDRVTFALVWTMRIQGTNGKYVIATKQLYTDMTACITMTSEVTIGNG